MAHVPGAGLRNLDRHLDRMADSAAYLGFPFDRRAAVARLTAVEGAVRVRLVLHRSGSVEVEIGPLPPPSDRPVRLTLDRDRPVNAHQVWLRHKTTRRSVYSSRA